MAATTRTSTTTTIGGIVGFTPYSIDRRAQHDGTLFSCMQFSIANNARRHGAKRPKRAHLYNGGAKETKKSLKSRRLHMGEKRCPRRATPNGPCRRYGGGIP